MASLIGRRGGGTTVEAADTRSRIQAAAIDLFTSNGYEQTSLRELADRVGITKASLYYHYPSKQALLLAILQPFLDEWQRTVSAAELMPRTPAAIRLAVARILDVMLHNRAVCEMLARDAPAVLAALAPVLEDLMAMRDQMYEWLAGPDPSPIDRLRAVAAAEALKAAFVAGTLVPEMPHEEVRRVLVECAAAVLGLPAEPSAPDEPSPLAEPSFPVDAPPAPLAEAPPSAGVPLAGAGLAAVLG
jgi:AcrR family transcriptional regulator